MKLLRLILASSAVVLGCTRDQPPADPPATTAAGTDSSLYRRLGGYDALAAVTDSFLARIAADTAINVFFAGIEPPHMNRIRQMVVDQLCAATGGPCLYVGKSMKETHATLDITNDVFEKFMGHLQSTLAVFSVKQREQDELIGALQSLKTEIVTK